MKLPVIKNEQPITEPSTCKGKDFCSSCALFVGNNGRCDGCTPKHQAQLSPAFSACDRECGTCTGHKVLVPAICCRSPLKDIYLTAVTKGAADWNKPEYSYTKRPILDYKQKAIFYISSGGVNTIVPKGKPLVPEDHEVVAVNITRVWSGNGFYSKDLKSYLRLSPNTKLLLMTMMLPWG